MVERVARAMAASRGGEITGPSRHRAADEFGWDGNGTYMCKYVESHWRKHVHAARAAIEAMREPTPAMIEAGFGRIFVGRIDYKPSSAETTRDAYRAMIDAALSEAPQDRRMP